MSLPSSRKSNHGDVNITPGVQNMPLSLSERPNRGYITITSGVKEIPVPNYRKQSDRGIAIISVGKKRHNLIPERA
jgi:hypothetical protein